MMEMFTDPASRQREVQAPQGAPGWLLSSTEVHSHDQALGSSSDSELIVSGL